MKKLTYFLFAILALCCNFKQSFAQAGAGWATSTTATETSTTDNVGIGTTTPTQNLHLVGNGFIDGHLAVGNNFTGNTNNDLELTNNAIVKGRMAIGVSVNSTTSYEPPAPLYVTSWGAYPGVRFDGQAPCLLELNGQQTNPIFQVRGLGVGSGLGGCSGFIGEYFNVMSGGNVGIGTSAPSARLHVIGDIISQSNDDELTTALLLKTTGDVPLMAWLSAGAEPFNIMFVDPTDFTPNYMIKLSPQGNIGTQNEPVPKITLLGRTAISSGTTTPDPASYIGNGTHSDYMLSVDGKLVARSYVTTQTAWSDFVFDKNYKLPTLQDEINSITQNHTLVGVPSQCDIEEKGIDLGATQAILLMKIEELYLHIIDLEKQLNALQTNSK